MPQYEQELRKLDLNLPVLSRISEIIAAKREQGHDVSSTRDKANIVGLSVEQYLAILNNTATAEELMVLAKQWHLLSVPEPEAEETIDLRLISEAGDDPLLKYVFAAENHLTSDGKSPSQALLCMFLDISTEEFEELGSDAVSQELRTKLMAQWKLA